MFSYNLCHFILSLRQIYIELFGLDEQPDNVPAKVHLKVRHRNSSYFRSGDKTVKKYMQRLEPRSIKFDRLTITDEKKCQERKRKSQDTGINSLIAAFFGYVTA